MGGWGFAPSRNGLVKGADGHLVLEQVGVGKLGTFHIGAMKLLTIWDPPAWVMFWDISPLAGLEETAGRWCERRDQNAHYRWGRISTWGRALSRTCRCIFQSESDGSEQSQRSNLCAGNKKDGMQDQPHWATRNYVWQTAWILEGFEAGDLCTHWLRVWDSDYAWSSEHNIQKALYRRFTFWDCERSADLSDVYYWTLMGHEAGSQYVADDMTSVPNTVGCGLCCFRVLLLGWLQSINEFRLIGG